MNNPWDELEPLNMIRIKETMKYNAFWIVDALNHYGLMIQCDEDFIQPIQEIKLNGIHIQLDSSSVPNKLILLLHETKDWEIFLMVCNDLINVMKQHDENIIFQVMNRLKRWQRLLQKKSYKKLSKEEQMGLFGELKVLEEYIMPKYGHSDGIHGCVGSLGDKQDFLLEDKSIEVKSSRTTAGNIIWISSKEQLNSEKKPLYLIICFLNETSNGESIDQLVKTIINNIESDSVLNEFIEKVESYGFFPDISQDNLSKFKLEKVDCYAVKEGFPKIPLVDISPVIKNLKYSIDLTGCSNFKMKIADILE